MESCDADSVWGPLLAWSLCINYVSKEIIYAGFSCYCSWLIYKVCDFTLGAAAEEKFDASQYAFFGGDVVEEVELGGLEDEEDLPPVVFDDKEYQLDREEVAFNFLAICIMFLDSFLTNLCLDRQCVKYQNNFVYIPSVFFWFVLIACFDMLLYFYYSYLECLICVSF